MLSEISLLPVVVLVVGVAIGIAVALALARKTPRSATTETGPAPSPDLLLADLEARRDELYERLREEELNDQERARLELSAARVLHQLDELGAPSGRGDAPQAPREEEPAAPARPSQGFRHPLLVGFLLGGGMVALIATLVLWAVRDAGPGAPSTAEQGATARVAPEGAPFDRGEPTLPPEVAAQVERLEARIEAEPDNLLPQKQLAQILLSHGQLFEAFQRAQSILSADPDDPDGNYVAAVVRLTMGQPEQSLEHLDRAIASVPEHAPAAMMQGLILLQMDRREEALAAWRRGLEAVGGSHPGLEHVLALAEQGMSAEEILASPPP